MESSQKIVQKIWKISQITSKCHVATNGTNGSGDKNLPNNERGQIGQIWWKSGQICGEIGQIQGNIKENGWAGEWGVIF